MGIFVRVEDGFKEAVLSGRNRKIMYMSSQKLSQSPQDLFTLKPNEIPARSRKGGQGS